MQGRGLLQNSVELPSTRLACLIGTTGIYMSSKSTYLHRAEFLLGYRHMEKIEVVFVIAIGVRL